MKGSLLVLDTATRTPIVALADRAGALLGEQRWESRHRHGEELLARIDLLLADQRAHRHDLAGVVVGTGPGSFTGLRIGLATAKTIAYSLGIPLTGVSTTVAVGAAALAAQPDLREVVVTLPAGAVDRYEHRVAAGRGGPEAVSPPELVATSAVPRADVVAIDLEPGAASASAVERGRVALEGLGASLARLGARQIAQGITSDPAELIPAYVALPRGIARAAAEMEWSPDLR